MGHKRNWTWECTADVVVDVDVQTDNLSDAEEDKALATRIKDERCENAFKRLFEKHEKLVRWQCYRHLFNAEDAEDATQIVFSSFWHEKCKKWHGGSVKGFLCKMARFTSIRMRQFGFENQMRDFLVSTDAEDEDGNAIMQLADPATEYSISREDEIEAEIDRVLISLPASEAACRLCWILQHREGYDSTEVAAIMGIKWQKVTALRMRAEGIIKASMREFYQRLIANDAEWLDNRIQFRRLFSE